MVRWLWSLIVLLIGARCSIAQTSNPIVIIETNHGVIKAELFADKAPLTVKNFIQYADGRFYDGTIFHRVIPNFMIQGGGMVSGLKEKKGRGPVKYEENSLRHVRGMIAMARAAAPDSGTSQFFINVVDLPHLDQIKPGYVVFGKVISGLEVVDKIKAVPTGNQAIHQNVPVEDVVIKAIRRASHFVLESNGTGAYACNKTFTLSAYVEHPIPGQFLTLELAPGLERIEGKEVQPVPAADLGMSLVVWRIRGVRSGDFNCVVRSSTGGVQIKKVKINNPNLQAEG